MKKKTRASGKLKLYFATLQEMEKVLKLKTKDWTDQDWDEFYKIWDTKEVIKCE